MTLTEFNKMSLARKSDTIWEWGYYLTSCKYGNYNVIIFSLGDFFVESCLNISENRTERIKAVSKDDLHNDYIAAINRDKPYMRPLLVKNKELLFPNAA